MKRRDFLMSAASVAAGLPIVTSWRTGSESSIAQLPRRPLGSTGVDVSILALGGVIAMSLPAEEGRDPVAIAERAFDLGINYFDTAPGYGNGQSESNVSTVVSSHRNQIFLATKVHFPRTYDDAMKSIEGSLNRLRTDHVDLLQVHSIGEEEDVRGWDERGGVYRALRELKEQGVSRFIGITGHLKADPMIQAINLYEFDTILMALNPTSNRRDFRERLVPAARSKNMGIIAMKVFGGGIGALVKGNPQEKIRSYHDEAAEQIEASDVVRYALGLPISTAAIGIDSIAQLEENVNTAIGFEPLTTEERTRLEELVG